MKHVIRFFLLSFHQNSSAVAIGWWNFTAARFYNFRTNFHRASFTRVVHLSGLLLLLLLLLLRILFSCAFSEHELQPHKLKVEIALLAVQQIEMGIKQQQQQIQKKIEVKYQMEQGNESKQNNIGMKSERMRMKKQQQQQQLVEAKIGIERKKNAICYCFLSALLKFLVQLIFPWHTRSWLFDPLIAFLSLSLPLCHDADNAKLFIQNKMPLLLMIAFFFSTLYYLYASLFNLLRWLSPF